MALIKLTAVVDNISGKLNGTVFARNKGGHYMRSKSMPTNPQTALQSNRRGIFGGIAAQWRELTIGQRRAWRNAAIDFPYINRIGDTKFLSGFSLFQKLNTNLSLIPAAAELAGPPSPQGVGAPTGGSGIIGLDAQGDLDLAELNFQTQGETSNAFAIVYATTAFSAGISNFKNRLRLIKTVAVPQGPGSQTLDIKNEYLQHFGNPKDEDTLGFGVRFVNINTGESSPLLQFSAEVYQN